MLGKHIASLIIYSRFLLLPPRNFCTLEVLHHAQRQQKKNAEQKKNEKLLETRKYLLKDFYLTRKVEINVESCSDEKRN